MNNTHLRTLQEWWRFYLQENIDCALATVIATEGSTYRKPGAQMLITKDGRKKGIIGGGCFDGQVIEYALNTMSNGKSGIFAFDTRSDEDAWLGTGLGCEGKTVIFIEPLRASMTLTEEDLTFNCKFKPTETITATIVSTTPSEMSIVGKRLFLSQETSTNNRDLWYHAIDQHLRDCPMQIGEASCFRTINIEKNTLKVFLHKHPPSDLLLILGSGDDVEPLARMALEQDFFVQIVDPKPRPDFLADLGSRCVYSSASVADWLQSNPEIAKHQHTYAIVMTHNLTRDIEGVVSLIKNSTIRYLGCLGPSLRFAKIRSVIEQSDRTATDLLAKIDVKSPAGLDIHCASPQNIALAIMAQIFEQKCKGQ